MSGGGGTNTTTTKADPWEAAQPYLKQGMAAAGDMFSGGMYEIDPYPFQRIAPQSDLTRAGQLAIANRALGGNPVTAAAEGAVINATDMDNQYRNFDTVRQNVMDRVLPQVNDQFSASGMAGSSLHSAAASDAATRALADVEYGAYDSASNRALAAAGLAPEMDKAAYLGGTMLNQVGGQQDQYNQALVNANRDYWNELQTSPLNAVERFGSLMTGYGGQGNSSTQSGGYSPGALDYASAGLSLLPFFFMSDERTKTDVEEIGETPAGLPVYSFRYKHELPPPHIGVMAQEAEQMFPGAVLEIDGVKHVNYTRLK